ncbi:relaxase/mobilization nuclease [Streptomyces leeuwenhoekii]|uniref:relaxase/mobilization nuclease n=1 Tax=Streptomyces leeuwenhoekii TaxID=1437453 RepID=UPI0037025075
MIPCLHARSHSPRDPLAEALGRPLSPDEGLTEYTVVAHWPGLDYYTLDDEQRTWTSVQWAEHLEDPYLEHPFSAGPDDDRRAILHLEIRLHPDDRELTGPEWAETAHRFARAAGIEVPGAAERGWRWIAVQAQPGRLDLIANLIHLDGTWRTPPADILRRLADEARRIEQDLNLVPAPAVRTAPTASAQLASVLSQLADEQSGPLATVRGLVGHMAHQFAGQAGTAGLEAAYRLELIAHRIRGIQQELGATASHVTAAPRPQAAVPTPPADRVSARPSLHERRFFAPG